jgi:hypothetical protein
MAMLNTCSKLLKLTNASVKQVAFLSSVPKPIRNPESFLNQVIKLVKLFLIHIKMF